MTGSKWPCSLILSDPPQTNVQTGKQYCNFALCAELAAGADAAPRRPALSRVKKNLPNHMNAAAVSGSPGLCERTSCYLVTADKRRDSRLLLMATWLPGKRVKWRRWKAGEAWGERQEFQWRDRGRLSLNHKGREEKTMWEK